MKPPAKIPNQKPRNKGNKTTLKWGTNFTAGLPMLTPT
jgi:hypothetical protein